MATIMRGLKCHVKLISLVISRESTRRANVGMCFNLQKISANALVTQNKTFMLASGIFRKESGEEGDNVEEKKKPVDPKKDRSIVVSPDTSILYLKSQAYKETYGGDPVWKSYRRNHKGGVPPRKTRKTCIRGDEISAGNPCPICRDEYLILDYRNTELLKQFIDPYTGETLKTSRTGLCRRQQFRLLVAMDKAKDHGYITFEVPVRKYDYSLYMPDKI